MSIDNFIHPHSLLRRLSVLGLADQTHGSIRVKIQLQRRVRAPISDLLATERNKCAAFATSKSRTHFHARIESGPHNKRCAEQSSEDRRTLSGMNMGTIG